MFDFNSLPAGRRHLRKVQLGAGKHCPSDWINIDIAGSPDLDIVQDLREPLPFPDNSIEEFYSHHVLEHFTIPELTSLLGEIRRCLKPGGRLVSRLPDFGDAIRQLVSEPPGEKRNALMLCVYGGRCFGWEPVPEHTHQTGWTVETLRTLLIQCGFLVEECKAIGSGSSLPCIDFVALKSTVPQLIAKRNIPLLEKGDDMPWGERQMEVPWLYANLKSGTVLDVGSAESCYVNGILDKGATKLVLNDIRDFSTHEDDERVSCVVGDIRKIPIAKLGLFDNVLLISTLEHVALDAYGQHREVPQDWSAYYPQRDALWYIMQFVKPGGQLLLTVPYGKYEDAGWVITYEKGMIDELKHFFNVTSETYYTLVDRNRDIWKEVPEHHCPKKGMDVHQRGMRATSVCCLVITQPEEPQEEQ